MIEILQGDITTLEVDAIVNAANPALLGGGGVDGAIHRAAGPDLLRACRALNGCRTGEAKITPGFKLPASWVIHTVGPIWQGGDYNEAGLLENAYRHTFELARMHTIQSMAFPAISTGVYGYPKAAACRIALSAMKQQAAAFDRIIACCYSQEDYRLYRQILAEPGKRQAPSV